MKVRFAHVLVAFAVVLMFSSLVFAGQQSVSWKDWTSVTGGWTVENNAYVNTDGADSNTIAYAAVEQTGTNLTFEWTINFKETSFSWGPAAGMHILSDSVDGPQRGTSYLVFQDYQYIRLYRSSGGSLPKVGDFPVTAEAGNVFSYKVEFNTKTGEMKIYRDGQLVGEWTDTDPIKSGKYVSVRTNSTIAAFTDLKVTCD